MCCEICPRYTSCEEEGHLNELCCRTCPEYSSCYKGDAGKVGELDETEDELDEV